MKRHAFTLIEVLVVVAIIALLVAILLPSLAAARMSARRSVSASNLRQIGVALEMYTTDHNGSFPETTHGNATQFHRSWIYTLGGKKLPWQSRTSSKYLANVDEIRICPADPKGLERLENNGTSYVMNEYIAVPVMDFGVVIEPAANRNRLKYPGQTIVMFVGADDLAVNESGDHIHSRSWFTKPNRWNAIRADIQPDRYAAGSPNAENTRGDSLYLYADTHANAINAAALKAYADEGRNFAEIPK